jgi:isopentenyl phosphate kinase
LQGDVYAKVKKGCVILPGDEILVDYTDMARVVMGLQ